MDREERFPDFSRGEERPGKATLGWLPGIRYCSRTRWFGNINTFKNVIVTNQPLVSPSVSFFFKMYVECVNIFSFPLFIECFI